MHALVGGAHGYFRSVELGHGRFQVHVLAAVLHVGGAVGEQAGGFYFGGHVGQLEADALEAADGLVELVALLAILGGSLQCALGDAQAKRSDADAAAVEHFQALHEAVAHLADDVANGHFAVGENQLGGFGGAHAQLVFFAAGREARRAALDDEGRHAVRVAHFAGAHNHHGHVAGFAVGNEVFRAVDDVVFATLIEHSGGAHVAGVGARVGLRQAPGPNPLARSQLGQVLLLLLLGGVLQNVAGAQRVVGGHAQANAAVDFGELDNGRYVLHVAEAGPAVLLGHEHAHQAELAELVKHVDGEFLALIPLHHVGLDVLGAKVAHHLRNHGLVFGRYGFH